jgi:hypothetical protein
MSSPPRWAVPAGLFVIAIASIGAYITSRATKPPAPSAAGDPTWFADVTDEVRLDFVHNPGPLDGAYFMPQSLGSGAGVIDLNNDGKLAIYLLHNAGPKSASKNRLYERLPEGRYRDISAGSGLDFAGYSMGVAVGDVNNDGLPDAYVSEYRGGRMFLNRGPREGGGPRFEEVKASGIGEQVWGTAVSFFDYDRDGWLDLVIVNYVALDPNYPCSGIGDSRDYCNPGNFPGTVTRLYRNRGCEDQGNWLGFEDRTEPSGLGSKIGPGLGVLCADIDGDGWPDILVANDGKANHLWMNQKNGTFREEAVLHGLAFNAAGEPQANMGVAYGDIDGSGLPSIFITHLTWEFHGLWKQGPRGWFQEKAAAADLTKMKWRGTGFGTVMGDFNQDGALDLALVNGRVSRRGPPSADHWDAYTERNQVLSNDGTGRFRDISESNPALCGKANVGRGLVVADLDGDGALDLLATTTAKPLLLRNVADKRGHWLLVRAVDPRLKRDAIGAEITVVAGGDGRASRRWQSLVQPSQSYLSSNDPRVHFGLGDDDRVAAIEVLWPDGLLESFPCPSVDRLVEVHRGQGQALKTPKP